MHEVPSPASDAVMTAAHPSPEDGGPCGGCAFREGTEANRSEHTVTLARLCVEGLTPFQCHEKPQLCRGWIAAVNLRGAPETDDDRRWSECAASASEIVATLIDAAVHAQSLTPTDAKEKE